MSGMARFERAPRDFGDLHATIDTTLLLMLNKFKDSTNRTCIDEFEVRYSTIELYPLILYPNGF
jgi:hypothetical protein